MNINMTMAMVMGIMGIIAELLTGIVLRTVAEEIIRTSDGKIIRVAEA